MKKPAVSPSNGPSEKFKLSPMIKNVTAAMTVAKVAKTLRIKTIFLETPLCSKSPKSPTSRGISWAATAKVTTMPLAGETRKAAAMAIPSIKLWMTSPSTIIGTTGSVDDLS